MYKITQKKVALCRRTNKWLDIKEGQEYDVIGFQDDRKADGKFYYRLANGDLYWSYYFSVTYLVPVYEEIEPSYCPCCGALISPEKLIKVT